MVSLHRTEQILRELATVFSFINTVQQSPHDQGCELLVLFATVDHGLE